MLDELVCSMTCTHTHLSRGRSGWLQALPSLLLPLHGLDVSVEPEVVVEASGGVQVVSGEGLQLSFTHISGAWEGEGRGGGVRWDGSCRKGDILTVLPISIHSQ